MYSFLFRLAKIANRFRKNALLALLVIATRAAGGNCEPAEELTRRAFFNLYAENYIQAMELITYPRGGRGMRRSIQVIRKQNGEPGKVLLRFVEPAFMRGTSVLIIEKDRNIDDLYIYLPAARMTRHLAVSQRSDAFFGTDLTYEDIEPKYVEDFEVEALGECGSGKNSGRLIQMWTKPKIESGYERMVSCIEEGRGSVLWTELFEGGEVVKRLDVDATSVKKVGPRLVPFKMTMRDLRRGSYTVIETKAFEVLSDIPERIFSARNLEVGSAREDRVALEKEEAPY